MKFKLNGKWNSNGISGLIPEVEIRFELIEWKWTNQKLIRELKLEVGLIWNQLEMDICMLRRYWVEANAGDRIMPDKKVHVYNIVWIDDFMSL